MTNRPPKPFNGGLAVIPDSHPSLDPDQPLEQSWWPTTGRVLFHHTSEACRPPCPIHQPGEHHMVTWPLHWRDDRRIFERICEHGIGHPDPDSTFREVDQVHGCCGCCQDPR